MTLSTCHWCGDTAPTVNVIEDGHVIALCSDDGCITDPYFATLPIVVLEDQQ